MKDRSGQDYSKIMARFAIRLNLTSKNVDEVIQKRLLEKKEEAFDHLTELYHNHQNNFQTLFHFVDGAQTYRNFRDKEDFIACYPFIPYQFGLFQKAIRSLSNNNAFEGKHRSVGERSMLGVFQQVVNEVTRDDIGKIATFDQMFDGISSSIKGQVQAAILNAENNLGNPFAVRLLKVLFMVKYVDDFMGTIRNLIILLIDDFDADINKLRNDLEESLTLLEREMYIQRNGENYEYLTNEEKDVEQEIKNTRIDDVDIMDQFDNVLFSSGEILKSLKIRYEENKQDYSFTRYIDDRQYGKEYEISIRVITPFYENYSKQELVMHSMSKPELLILLPTDKRFLHDLEMFLKTEKCYQQRYSSIQKESTRRILYDKNQQNRERRKNIKDSLEKLIVLAELYVAGEAIEIESTNANTRIIQAFQIVIEKTYPHLKIIGNTVYSEQDIDRSIHDSQTRLDYGEGLTEAEQEVFNHVSTNSRMGKRVTVKEIVDHFSKRPYGWGLYAVLVQIARLYAQNKLEVYFDGNLIEDYELSKTLKNTARHQNLILQPQQEITASQVRRLKDLYSFLFDKPSSGNDAKSVAKETGEALDNLNKQIEEYLRQREAYPFLENLTPVSNKLREAKGKPYPWFYSEFINNDDELKKLKEDVIQPIFRFMTGEQRNIYNEIREFLKTNEPNFSYLDEERVKKLVNTTQDPDGFKGNKIQQMKADLDILKDKLQKLLQEERSKAEKKIRELTESFIREDLSRETLESINSAKKIALQSIGNSNLIAVIKDVVQRFEENCQKIRLEKDPYKPEKKDDLVHSRDIKVNYTKDSIDTEQEVEQYSSLLKKAYQEEIKKGKRIKL